ncbi:bifunctional diaminohydroxyphosphoribosylaminopyrimidine deaminase/5-amino-6-(5-phosphoribosylamino)uracil reductase RibD [Falsihalocynthiibacter sp. BN13B15]|uniref:bifunctional diaminohydroxyphosphoribosylaminopyrimidine deaminase/5-amino-6-(5-phosphoribosylamino)uracil reductase RibD n=1 Tax=Falsihalocynthiibacter sp. BN13B15 TaxID=3240871 RepID=UPI00350F85A0
MQSRLQDERFMRRALILGAQGLGQVWPNPSVGCVVVHSDQIIAEGVTANGGRPHAEVVALEQAGVHARGATAYVTLEPCTHTGKSGPCTHALITAGIARVVYAIEDVDPRVAGRAKALLEAAGISVTTGVLETQARETHSGFFKAKEQGLPFVTLKLATSIDGRIATQTGESKWITGAAARHHVHAMRACHDAVLVGGGTARSDDPMLNVRDLGVVRQPIRVVASALLDIPLGGKLAATAGEIPLWICHQSGASNFLKDAWIGIGAKLVEVELGVDRKLSARAMMSTLANEGLTRVYCEGGGHLAASMLNAGLVDDLMTYTAGVVIGGDGLAGIAPMQLNKLSKAQRFKLIEARAIGDDVLHHWRVL